jgi:hypothetical protein
MPELEKMWMGRGSPNLALIVLWHGGFTSIELESFLVVPSWFVVFECQLLGILSMFHMFVVICYILVYVCCMSMCKMLQVVLNIC